MNDEFLYLLREEPEPEFTRVLRQELTQSTPTNPGHDRKKAASLDRHPYARRLAWGLVALVLAFALLMVVSPIARAAVTDIIERIIVKGTTVWVSEDIPAISGESETYSEIWTPVSPGDISAGYPVFARLPAWVPSGYILQGRAALFGSMTHDTPYSVLVEWKNKYGDTIQLKVAKGSCPNGQVWESGAPRSDCTYGWGFNVDSESKPEVVMINGKSAVLLPDLQILMDLSDPIREWNPYRVKYDNRNPDAFFLIWESDGMRFEIATESPTISKKDLIRLAESIP